MQGELTPDSFAAFTSIGLLAIVFVAGVGRIAGAVVAGIMFSSAGLFVTSSTSASASASTRRSWPASRSC